MAFRPGDYVYPADLPRRLLCRVASAESATTGTDAFRILTLEPVERPEEQWPAGTFLVRLDEHVLPAPARDLWRAGAA